MHFGLSTSLRLRRGLTLSHKPEMRRITIVVISRGSGLRKV
jgi:hypothetical protein